MKYRVYVGSEEIAVILEYGGVACIRDVDGEDRQSVTEYYQDRFTQEMLANGDIWEQLAEGKVYCKDWNTPANSPEHITDALNWLCVDCDSFELDETIWPDFEI